MSMQQGAQYSAVNGSAPGQRLDIWQQMGRINEDIWQHIGESKTFASQEIH